MEYPIRTRLDFLRAATIMGEHFKAPPRREGVRIFGEIDAPADDDED
jgi:hypothetical protein